MGSLDNWVTGVTFATAVGAALIAGVFYAFSTFVMKALARLPADEAVAAMQSINVVVINPLFLGVFLGAAAASAALIVASLLRLDRPGAACLLAGALLYLVGTFGVTIVFNVPLNNVLAQVTRGAPDAAARWADYLTRWTAWNHVRTAAGLAAAVALGLALRR